MSQTESQISAEITIAGLKQISFISDSFNWQLPDCQIKQNEWICFSPQADEVYPDSSVALARILGGIDCEFKGDLALLGQNFSSLTYDQRLQLRRRIGYVHNSGALLANRSVIDNIRYPLDFKADSSFDLDQVNQQIVHLMIILGISPYKNHRPHDLDEIVRWRTCLCRALIIEPDLLIFEGIGDWSYSHGNGMVWHYLKDQQKKQNRAICFCLSKKNIFFENWLTAVGGRVIHYSLQETE